MLASLVSYVWTRRRTPKEWHRALEDCLPYMTVGAIIGARALYVVQNPDLWTRPAEALALWKGGLVSYGGMLGAIAAWILFLRSRDLPVTRFSDALAPTALLGWGVGRLGCLLSWYGEYGRLSDLPWAFQVGHESRHPVMLYLSIGLCLAAWVVTKLEHRWSATGLALMLYGLVRALCDFWRDYDPSYLQYTSQAFALFLSLVGLILLWKLPPSEVFTAEEDEQSA